MSLSHPSLTSRTLKLFGKTIILWMDEILHHFETMTNDNLLVFTGESSFQGFLGGAGSCPSTVVVNDKLVSSFFLGNLDQKRQPETRKAR